MLIIPIILIGLIVVLALVAISSYNTLISLKNKVYEAESDIDVQLKRRYDLIPNLVNTVKGYAKHESETFEKVIKARQQAVDISGITKEKPKLRICFLGL